MSDMQHAVTGAGLGLRRAHLGALEHETPDPIGFFEVAPENWIDVGGKFLRKLRRIRERTPIVCHGLSLNLGGSAPLDEEFILQVKQFLETHRIPLYSEHLSYCADDAHLYDLLPIPFTDEAVHHVASRIRRVQEMLERSIAIENVSYYCAPGQEMREIEFVKAVLDEADCGLLLDLNNVYVNSVNQGYDAEEFLRAIPGHRIAYAHVAGHYQQAPGLIIDTHAATVIDPVWALLDTAYQCFGPFATVLERDFDIPPLADLLPEVLRVHQTQMRHRAPLGQTELAGG